MLITENSIIFNKLHFPPSYPLPKNNGRKLTTALAKRKDFSETSRTQKHSIFPLNVPNIILARSIVTVLGLGFIDAGYSGDWSRIGVISKESENLLKIAAFVVVPLCVFLIFSFTKENED